MIERRAVVVGFVVVVAVVAVVAVVVMLKDCRQKYKERHIS